MAARSLSAVVIAVSMVSLGLGAAIASAAPITVLDHQVDPANGHTYYLLSAATWTASEDYAKTLGGDLATINDAAENTWVLDNFGQLADLWIGHNDAQSEGNFVWADGEDPGYTNWRSGQPDNYAGVGGEDYVHIYGKQVPNPAIAGFWNDAADDPSVYSNFNFFPEVSIIEGVVEVAAPLPSPVVGGTALIAGCAVAHGTRRRRRVAVRAR